MCMMVHRKGLLVFLLFAIPILAASGHQNHGSHQHFTGIFKSLFNTPYRLWLNLLDKTQRNSKKSIEDNRETTDVFTLAELKRTNNLELPSTTVEGSIVPNEDLHVSHFSKPFLRENRQGNGCSCSCIPTPTCETTCSSLEIQCGQTCTHITIFTADSDYYGGGYVPSLSTSLAIYNNNCDSLGYACTTTVTVANVAMANAAVVIAIAAVAIAVAVPVGLHQTSTDQFIPIEETDQFIPIEQTDQISFDIVIENNTPVSELTFPENGIDFRFDGCGNNFVQFSDGNCQPVLRRGNCSNPQHWVTLDPITLQGRCTPRLCGRERVFIGRDGLCHDIYDPGECQGGRRLYYTAFGDPICDCPIGQYPFPNIQDDCVALFSKGPCRDGSVVGISPQGRLDCIPAECQSMDFGNKPLQMVSTQNGVCYALGTQGPCSTTSRLLGYDIFKRQPECVDVENTTSPYFLSSREAELLDRIYNQLAPDDDDYRVSLVFGNNDIGQRRQGANTGGIFQFPSSSPETLLQPCRTGARRGTNYKCTNPLVPNLRPRETLQAVRPAFRCPPNRSLQATGRCVNDNRAASCGPSFRFNSATGQCRSIF